MKQTFSIFIFLRNQFSHGMESVFHTCRALRSFVWFRRPSDHKWWFSYLAEMPRDMWLIWIQEVFAGDFHALLRFPCVWKFRLVESSFYCYFARMKTVACLSVRIRVPECKFHRVIYNFWLKNHAKKIARESLVWAITTFKIKLTVSNFVSLLGAKNPRLVSVFEFNRWLFNRTFG